MHVVICDMGLHACGSWYADGMYNGAVGQSMTFMWPVEARDRRESSAVAHHDWSVALTSGLVLYKPVRSTFTTPRKSGALRIPSKSHMLRISWWS